MINETIKIGTHVLTKIDYEDLKPGDFLCTYEWLTTAPYLLTLQSLQKYLSLSSRPELNKMFHAEVILEKMPRRGFFKIAHADGGSKIVKIQLDNFGEHHPGQAFIIFRAKDKQIRKEITRVASKTAETNNGHICRAVNLLSAEKINFFLRSFCFENLYKNKKNELKKLEIKFINFDRNGTFFSEDSSISKTMSCVEYISNVINVAALRVRRRRNPTQPLQASVQELNRENYPIVLCNTNTTPAYFVGHFFRHPKHFFPLGYIGSISEPLRGPLLDNKGELKQISPSLLTKILPEVSGLEKTEEHVYRAAKMMKTLGMIDSSWNLFLKPAQDKTKIATLLSALHFSNNNTLVPKIDHEVDCFLKKLKIICFSKNNIQTNQLKKITNLTNEEIARLLLLERKIISEDNKYKRTEKTLKLSINYFAQKFTETNTIKKFSKKMLKLARTLVKTIVLSPFYFPFFIVGKSLELISIRKKEIIQNDFNNLLILHEKIRKNASIEVHLNDVPANRRLWIHYSQDGKRWETEPFLFQSGKWIASFRILKDSYFSYRLFVGPDNCEDPHPFEKSLAVTKKVHHSDHEIIWNVENHEECARLPLCAPIWKKNRNFSYSASVLNYKNKCSQICPEDDTPITIQEYENHFTAIENEIEPKCVSPFFTEEECVRHLRTFISKELGLDIPTKQIKLLSGGLRQGLSKDKIYKIYDENFRPQFIVKVFTASRGKFSREFYTLMNHHNLGMKFMNIPRVLGFGSTKADQSLYFLALEYVQGDSLYEKFMELVKHEIGSHERTHCFNKLIEIYEHLGKAIAEFHQLSCGTLRPLHPLLLNLFQAFSFNAFRKLENVFEPKLLIKLKLYFEKNLHRLKEKRHFRGYHHGDINVGNILYNDFTKCLSVIDWPDGSFSVGKEGVPLGMPHYDLIQVKNELLNMQAEGVTEEERSALYQAFERKYKEKFPEKPSKKTLDFFSAIDLLGAIKWFEDKKDQFAEKQFPIARKIFELKLRELASIID